VRLRGRGSRGGWEVIADLCFLGNGHIVCKQWDFLVLVYGSGVGRKEGGALLK
jgi:hypothetical protein